MDGDDLLKKMQVMLEDLKSEGLELYDAGTKGSPRTFRESCEVAATEARQFALKVISENN